MNNQHQSEQAVKRRRIGLVLTIVFVCALLLGPGPGILLVNRAEPVFGYPPIYLWALLWYVVEVTVVILAYFYVWSDDDENA